MQRYTPRLVPACVALSLTLAAGTVRADGDRPDGETPKAAKLEFIDMSALAPIITTVEQKSAAELQSDMTCERRRPTGTRITRERCYTQEAGADAATPQRRQMLEDIQQMRDTQRLRDLANQAALQSIYQQRAAASAGQP